VRTLTISKDTAKAILWEDQDEYELVTSTNEGSSRWSTHHTMIFTDKAGTVWGAEYSVGKSESQDEGAFEYAADPVVCTEMIRTEKTIVKVVYVTAP
jgi:hypothetical protein